VISDQAGSGRRSIDIDLHAIHVALAVDLGRQRYALSRGWSLYET
jgi:hypothetical protein